MERGRFETSIGRIFLFLAIVALVGAWISQIRGGTLFGMTQQHLFLDSVAMSLLGLGFLSDALIRRFTAETSETGARRAAPSAAAARA